MIVVVMGVSGSGQDRVGQALATDLGWPFFDADDFHPEANVAKMAAGTPLTDADRWPWLDRLAAEMKAIDGRGANAVLACSALRQAYRDRISRAGDVRFVHLAGDHDTIAARLARARKHHYMPPTLLASQLATLEAPTDAIVIDVRDAVPVQVAKIRAALKLRKHLGERMSDEQTTKPATRAVHLGRNPDKFLGAVNTPVFRASTMLFPTVADARAGGARRIRGDRLRLARPADGHRPAGHGRGDRGRASLRSPCRRGSPRRRLPLLALADVRATTCSSPMRSTARRGASATIT